MKYKLLLLASMLSVGTASAAEITKESLAQEVAYCYAAHKNSQTDYFKEKKADNYIKLIESLVGENDARKMLNSADDKLKVIDNGVVLYTETGARTGRPNFDKSYAKKYCSSIDEKLSTLAKKA